MISRLTITYATQRDLQLEAQVRQALLSTHSLSNKNVRSFSYLLPS